MEPKCPCIDCITLAICKAEMAKSNGRWTTLIIRCSIFKEFYRHAHVTDKGWQDLLSLYNKWQNKGGINDNT